MVEAFKNMVMKSILGSILLKEVCENNTVKNFMSIDKIHGIRWRKIKLFVLPLNLKNMVINLG